MESIGVEYMKYGAIGLAAFVILIVAAYSLRIAVLSHKTFIEESRAGRAESAATRDAFLNAMEDQRRAGQAFQENHLAPVTQGLKDVCTTLAGLAAKVDDCPERGKQA